MSQESQRSFITAKVANADFGLPVKIPNLPFVQPTNAPWAEFYLMGGTPPIVAGGSGPGMIVERTIRMIQLSIWIPEGKGLKPGTDPLDVFENLFAYKIGRDKDGLAYEFKGMQSFTPTVGAGWTCLVGRIPYRVDRQTRIPVTATL